MKHGQRSVQVKHGCFPALYRLRRDVVRQQARFAVFHLVPLSIV